MKLHTFKISWHNAKFVWHKRCARLWLRIAVFATARTTVHETRMDVLNRKLWETTARIEREIAEIEKEITQAEK